MIVLLFLSLATSKCKVIGLGDIEMNIISDNKERVIRLKFSSNSNLVLKAESTQKFNAWYNQLQYTIIHKKSSISLECLDRALKETEYNIARTDRKEITALYAGIEAALETEERRNAVFENLSCYKEEYMYLGELYNILQAFETMRKLGKYNDALLCAENIYQMVTSFNLNDNSLLHNKKLEERVRQLMSSLVGENVINDIEVKLKDVHSNNPNNIKDLELFRDLRHNLLKKIESARKEISADNKRHVPIQDMKLLEIPIKYYKKSCHWTVLNFLEEKELMNSSAYKRDGMRLQRFYTQKENPIVLVKVDASKNTSDILERSKGKLTYRGNSGILDI